MKIYRAMRVMRGGDQNSQIYDNEYGIILRGNYSTVMVHENDGK